MTPGLRQRANIVPYFEYAHLTAGDYLRGNEVWLKIRHCHCRPAGSRENGKGIKYSTTSKVLGFVF